MQKFTPYTGQKLVVCKLNEDDDALNNGMKPGHQGIVVKVLSRKDYGSDRIWIYVTRMHQFYSVSYNQVTPKGHYSYSQINRIITDIKSHDAFKNEKELTLPILKGLNNAKKIFKLVDGKESV